MSTEVFDLKYTASFYALMISLLVASTLATHQSKQLINQPSETRIKEATGDSPYV
jgi:hypothetical protein